MVNKSFDTLQQNRNTIYESKSPASVRGRGIKGGAFTRAKRFVYSSINNNGIMPGPADYANLISRNKRLYQSFTRAPRATQAAEEVSPGPSTYIPHVYTKKSAITLPKVFFVSEII